MWRAVFVHSCFVCALPSPPTNHVCSLVSAPKATMVGNFHFYLAAVPLSPSILPLRSDLIPLFPFRSLVTLLLRLALFHLTPKAPLPLLPPCSPTTQLRGVVPIRQQLTRLYLPHSLMLDFIYFRVCPFEEYVT